MAAIGVWEQAEPGVTRKVFQPGIGLMMMEVHFEEGAEGALHSHPHEQMSYCLKGVIEFKINGEKTLVRQGDTIVIPGGAEHGVKALEPSALLDTFTPLRLDLLGT
ncbi:cupin domain-containing protein [Paenibacillus glucanolyticus]|jgi:quercetin dioxygenase-like cupin family protein|uniref:cupin domain-containing protein n=1 Tax=Paenibacillus TaxID=44249 RepID=UPI0003E27801|nr:MULTISPECIES: cupin domain-containing protein [Paenibacillus]ANA81552.1 cupin [Paenibacillus glucanolyticus]AVV59717.1 cupin domain-containing protein [Paenibacillus glucanolyticus]ETT30414.1 Cupin 2 barrel domain-containing protein [Paenibacillus sp. FSL R5-808]OMF74198.1 cupin [Paenibacillus glucanolyticus]